jgi:hypothetical protein
VSDRFYDVETLVDAPEHHAYSRALGILTWSTWDHGVRPADQRIADFVTTFPPHDPVRYSAGGSLTRQSDGTMAPGTTESRLERFRAGDWRAGSLHELLARYGLRASDGPAFQERPFVPGSMRDTARRRNVKLRVLHGGVDIEPADMDAAKASLLELQEKKKAAEEVREALKRMNADLDKERPR